MLGHIRVIDLCNGVSQFGSHLMSRLGAEVIAVEPPAGVATRHAGPFVDDIRDPNSSLTHWAYNRGKKSVILDLSAARDRDTFLDLVSTADILFEDQTPGRLASVGLAYSDLAIVNPQLIHSSITPYGSTGPRSHWQGSDITAVAGSSFMHISGDADRAPLRVGLPHSFLQASADAAAASLIAIQERHKSGHGQHIDVSAQESLTHANPSDLSHLANATSVRRMAGGVNTGGIEIPLVFPCKDGYTISVILPGAAFGRFADRLTNWINEDGMADQNILSLDWENLGTHLLNGEISGEVVVSAFQTFGTFLATKTKAELWAAALEKNLLITPSMTIADLVEYEHLEARRFWERQDAGNGKYALYPGQLVKFKSHVDTTSHKPSKLGEHNELLDTIRRKPTQISRPKSTSLPLDGLKILEFSWVIATPSAVRILCDYGATVVKVETASRPDTMRTVNPFVDDQPHPDNSVGYGVYNAGKRSISLDLSNPESREVVLDLIRWADVVTESFAPGTMKRLGYGYETLSEINPQLIMLSSSLLGQTGPHSTIAGYGFMAAAIAGYYELTGWADRPPAGPYGPYTDYLAPRVVVAALMAALENRNRTGEGEYIDLSQTEAALHYLAPAILDQSINGRTVQRQGNDDAHMYPHGVYPSAGEDSWIALACTDAMWPALAKKIRLDNMADLNQTDRRAQRDVIETAISTWTATITNTAAAEELQASLIDAYPVNDSKKVTTDPQLRFRKHQIQVPQSHSGEMWTHSCRTKMSRTPAKLERGGPCLGEDNFEILSEFLGYSVDRIAEIAAAEALE